jgi:hypothetical protein
VVGFSSGTAALHVALRLCGVGPGDEVWGSTLTFIGGVAPIIYQGAEPVFFDVGPDMLIDLDLLEAELGVAAKKGKLLKVLVTTDLYGHVPDLSRIERLVAEYGFDWISDSAEALGSTRDGRHAGKGGAVCDLVVQRQQDHYDLRRRRSCERRPGPDSSGAIPVDPSARRIWFHGRSQWATQQLLGHNGRYRPSVGWDRSRAYQARARKAGHREPSPMEADTPTAGFRECSDEGRHRCRRIFCQLALSAIRIGDDRYRHRARGCDNHRRSALIGSSRRREFGLRSPDRGRPGENHTLHTIWSALAVCGKTGKFELLPFRYGALCW